MNNITIKARKEKIAADFISNHAANDFNDWSIQSHNSDLIAVYYNLIGGLYGDFEDNGLGDMTIEIDASDSCTGCACLFEISHDDFNLTDRG
jgi:hypothetical protein